MTTNDCSNKKIIEYITKSKQKGQKNQEIIKQIIKKGCCYTALFNAMDETTKNGARK